MSDIIRISPEEIEILCKFDTPTVCNVIEVFDVRPRERGYMDSRISACSPQMPPMVGYATTATYRSAAPARGITAYDQLNRQIESFGEIPEPRVVVFQDLDNPPAAATFGEVMCNIYKNFGCAGLITSGAGRDLDQVEAIPFPTFTSGMICAHGNCHIVSLNDPVHVGGLTVYPGDLLHGDRNGVTTIPNAIAGYVARLCADYMAGEEVVVSAAQRGADLGGIVEARSQWQECLTGLQARAKEMMNG